MKNMLFALSAVLILSFAAFAQEVPQVEAFGGYSFLRVNVPDLNHGYNFNGWNGSLAINGNRWFGMVLDFNGHYKTIQESGFDFDTNAHSFLFGPQLSLRKHDKLTPFAQALFGFTHLDQNISPVPSNGVAAKDWNDFAMALGGGLDVKVHPKVAIRLFQVDYFLMRDKGGSANNLQDTLNNFRFSSGIVFRLGRKNLAPPTVTLTASKSTIIQGETTALQAKGTDPDGGKLTYSWSSAGGKVTGTGENATFDSTGLAPGKYPVTVTASDGKYSASATENVTVLKRNVAPVVSIEPASGNITQGDSLPMRCVASDANNDPLTYSWTVNGQPLASSANSITFGTEGRSPGQYTVACAASDGEATTTATAPVTVKEYIRPNQPPRVDCLSTTVDVASGQTAQLNANATDPDNDKLTFTWTAGAGSVSGSGSTATYNASGATAGNYTVTMTADDGRGGKASCSMTVRVSERVLLTREGERPCGYFATGGRVLDNCAKAALDDLAVRMKNDPRLQAKVIGYTDGSRYESSMKTLGERRAKAVSAYLEKKGVDASRLTVVNEGANNPVGDNKKAAGRKLNRRVEIELTSR
jgi:outer membrane protein OmpA-like peptidoglycan-associated protein/opacity protein-like surface antigen